MKKSNFFKINMGLLLIFCISFSLFSFKDNSETVMVNERVIKKLSTGAFYEKGKLNIMFKNQINDFSFKSFGIEQIDRVINEFNVSHIQQLFPLKADVSKRMKGDDNLSKIFSIKYEGNIDPFEMSQQIMETYGSMLQWVEPAFVYVSDYIPNDPTYNSQYHISKVNALQAWDITKGDTNIVIGIVDTGSDLDHPDLEANIKIKYSEYPPNGIDDDSNNFVDDWRGWDFIGDGSSADNEPQVFGNNCAHGSHVSGCASEITDNATGGAGVGFKTKLLISKHGDDDDFSAPGGLSFVYSPELGIVYCYQNGAKVINCSYGSSSPSSFIQEICNNAWSAGAVICASAGNSGVNEIRYPAAYDNVVSVASSDASDLRSGFSTYHSTVDVTAPGTAIVTTYWNNTYTSLQGTSFSSPITAGTVGLIRSVHPTWTPQQTVDRLLLAVDSIYGIPANLPYVGLLGSGRVNAFKAVSDLPIVKVLAFNSNDSLYGNSDGVYEIGERVPIKLNFKNTWLSGSNLSLRLTTTDPDVEIIKDSVFVGNLAAYGSYSTDYANTFEVKAKPTCPFDKLVTFKISNSPSLYGDDNSVPINIRFREGFAVHNLNNLKLAVTKDGAIGKKTEAYGSGLKINGNPAANHILEGGLMIGVSNTKVSDVCRKGGTPATTSDTDFTALKTYAIIPPGQIPAQSGDGLFNDNGAGANKIGVEVISSSYAFNSAGNDNFVILKYNIKNNSGAPISDLYAGVFMYYKPNDITSGNITAADSINKIGYTYGATVSNPYLGVSLLTNQNYGIKPITGSEVIGGGFTAQEKWDALSFGRVGAQIGPGTNCFVVSAGPLNIPTGESVTVGFAVVKGNDLTELLANNTAAVNKYQTVNINQISNTVPVKFELSQNYPNPFNPTTKINFAIPKSSFVTLKIYDILGKLVESIVNEKLEAGSYAADFTGLNISSGTYFYRIEAGEFAETKRMVLIK